MIRTRKRLNSFDFAVSVSLKLKLVSESSTFWTTIPDITQWKWRFKLVLHRSKINSAISTRAAGPHATVKSGGLVFLRPGWLLKIYKHHIFSIANFYPLWENALGKALEALAEFQRKCYGCLEFINTTPWKYGYYPWANKDWLGGVKDGIHGTCVGILEMIPITLSNVNRAIPRVLR